MQLSVGLSTCSKNTDARFFADCAAAGIACVEVSPRQDAYDAAVLAADYTVACIEVTQGDPDHWYGVKFELELPKFIRMLGR